MGISFGPSIEALKAHHMQNYILHAPIAIQQSHYVRF